MTVLAAYYVLRDSKFTLATAGSTQPFTVTLPVDFVDTFTTPPAPAHLPFLAFALDTGTPSNLVFRITTANSIAPAVVEQFRATFNSDVYETVHEVINLGTLVPGPATNTITFERISGTGTLEISDVVLLYKRNIAAVAAGTE